jgi:DNA-binding NarL/FixJ family response regulator
MAAVSDDDTMAEERATIRVLIVDDHPVVRGGLRSFLELHEDLEVVGDAATAGEAAALIAGTAPDVVLLDVQLSDRSGLTLLPELVALDPAPQVLILTSFLDDEAVRRSVDLGASGFLLKHAAPDTIVDGIRASVRGELALDPAAVRVLASRRREPLDELTPRERQVLEQIARGRTNRDIAQTLVITEKTVKTHVSAILAKLGVADRTQAAVYAKDHGL